MQYLILFCFICQFCSKRLLGVTNKQLETRTTCLLFGELSASDLKCMSLTEMKTDNKNGNKFMEIPPPRPIPTYWFDLICGNGLLLPILCQHAFKN